MSHEVETMAYTNEVPWHGLGEYIADAPNVDEMLRIAGLDWRVERRPLYVMPHTLEEDAPKTSAKTGAPRVSGFAALTRDSDGSVLDIVGSRYIPAQNAEVFEFFDEFVEAGDATMETAGSLRGGRYVWGLANLKAGFKLRGDDQVNGYLLVAIPHEQGKSLIIRFTTVRVVCNNTLTLALRSKGAEFRMNHRNIFDEKMIERARDTLGIAREQVGEFEVNARKLQKLRLTRDDTIRVLAPTFQPRMEVQEIIADFDTNASPTMKSLLDINENAPGAQPGNGWGVLNAVTYFADHVASRSPDKRLTNAWLGKTARSKEKVLDALLELAA